MPEEILRILLDQNIPQTLSGWLKDKMPDWEIQHVNELGFQGKPDEFLSKNPCKKTQVIYNNLNELNDQNDPNDPNHLKHLNGNIYSLFKL